MRGLSLNAFSMFEKSIIVVERLILSPSTESALTLRVNTTAKAIDGVSPFVLIFERMSLHAKLTIASDKSRKRLVAVQ